jgi:hypothetical protein
VIWLASRAASDLIGQARQRIPAEPGRLDHFDYEYRRNGAVNLFVFLDAVRSWPRVEVTVLDTEEGGAMTISAIRAKMREAINRTLLAGARQEKVE